jgi:hypothetical protein
VSALKFLPPPWIAYGVKTITSFGRTGGRTSRSAHRAPVIAGTV